MEEIDIKDLKCPNKRQLKVQELVNNLDNNYENFWISEWFKKVPNAECFAEWWFQRDDVIILIDIIKNCFKLDIDWKLQIEFNKVLNHFLRNWANSALAWEAKIKKETYSNYLYLIYAINTMDEEKKLSFLNRLKEISDLHCDGNFMYKKWSNRIEVMVEEIRKMI